MPSGGGSGIIPGVTLAESSTTISQRQHEFSVSGKGVACFFGPSFPMGNQCCSVPYLFRQLFAAKISALLLPASCVFACMVS
jgi:hypothetical protein